MGPVKAYFPQTVCITGEGLMPAYTRFPFFPGRSIFSHFFFIKLGVSEYVTDEIHDILQ